MTSWVVFVKVNGTSSVSSMSLSQLLSCDCCMTFMMSSSVSQGLVCRLIIINCYNFIHFISLQWSIVWIHKESRISPWFLKLSLSFKTLSSDFARPELTQFFIVFIDSSYSKHYLLNLWHLKQLTFLNNHKTSIV